MYTVFIYIFSINIFFFCNRLQKKRYNIILVAKIACFPPAATPSVEKMLTSFHTAAVHTHGFRFIRCD